MSLFNLRQGAVDGREAVTLVGEEAYFHGVLSVKGSLRVEGLVEGDVTDAVSVEVGRTGRVKGNIAAQSLSVAGEVQGDVVASQSIELLAQSRLTGNVRTSSFHVEEGALFNGKCAMGDLKDSSLRDPREILDIQPALKSLA